MDHVPARAFFVKRKHPKGMEFPACKSCQNRTSDAEDMTRLLTILQGTARNTDMLSYFNQKEASIVRGLIQRKPKLMSAGEFYQGHPVVRLDERVQEMIIETHRKIALALYYKITEKALDSSKRMAFSFFNMEKEEIPEKILKMMNGLPLDNSMRDPAVLKQFRYKFARFPDTELGLELYLATWLHGLVCLIAFFTSDSAADGKFRDILRSPFEP